MHFEGVFIMKKNHRTQNKKVVCLFTLILHLPTQKNASNIHISPISFGLEMYNLFIISLMGKKTYPYRKKTFKKMNRNLIENTMPKAILHCS